MQFLYTTHRRLHSLTIQRLVAALPAPRLLYSHIRSAVLYCGYSTSTPIWDRIDTLLIGFNLFTNQLRFNPVSLNTLLSVSLSAAFFRLFRLHPIQRQFDTLNRSAVLIDGYGLSPYLPGVPPFQAIQFPDLSLICPAISAVVCRYLLPSLAPQSF